MRISGTEPSSVILVVFMLHGLTSLNTSLQKYFITGHLFYAMEDFQFTLVIKVLIAYLWGRFGSEGLI